MEGEGGMSPEEIGSHNPERSTSEGEPEEETSQEAEGYEETGEAFARADPDVLLDVPKVNIEELNLEVEDLKARVALRTRLADLLEIDVGLDVSLGTAKLESKGVEAEAQLRARLDTVQAMIERTLSSVDANPGLIKDLSDLSRGPAKEEDEQPALEEADSGKEITEAARKKAEELGMDPTSLEGTGSGGRITLKDVRRASRDG